MSLEKFIKKLKKFLENRGAKLLSIETKCYDSNEFYFVAICFEYNGADLYCSRQTKFTSHSLKGFTTLLFTDIVYNLNNIKKLEAAK